MSFGTWQQEELECILHSTAMAARLSPSAEYQAGFLLALLMIAAALGISVPDTNAPTTELLDAGR